MQVIAFVIRNNSGKSQYYSASVKPFVDISYGLNLLGYNSVLLLHRMEKHLLGKIETVTNKNVRVIFFEDHTLVEQLKEINADFVVVDDDLEIMKKLAVLKLDKIKKVVYVQYLYGVNSNRRFLRKRSLKLRIASILPWNFLTFFYRHYMSYFDFVISNSNTCGYMLDKFYDVNCSGTVYPPVGVDMRSIIERNKMKDKIGEILVFLGNLKNDFYLRDLSREIYLLKSRMNTEIKLFATDKETADHFLKMGFHVIYHVQVEELVKLMSSSFFTYVPTTFELFGYVGAESLLCGTPVILDTYHPFMERLSAISNSIIISNPKRSIADELISISSSYPDMHAAQNEVYSNYSPEESAKMLLKALGVF